MLHTLSTDSAPFLPESKIRERKHDGFNKKLGHGNAVELDQSKWMYHSTNFRNNHKIGIQEEILLFEAIERVMTIGDD